MWWWWFSLLSAASPSLQPPAVSSCDSAGSEVRGQGSGQSQGHVTGVISTNIYTCVFLYRFRRVPFCVLNHRCQRQKSDPETFASLLRPLLLFWLWLRCYYGLSVCVPRAIVGGTRGNRLSIIDDWMKRRKWDSESSGEGRGTQTTADWPHYLLYVYVYFILCVLYTIGLLYTTVQGHPGVTPSFILFNLFLIMLWFFAFVNVGSLFYTEFLICLLCPFILCCSLWHSPNKPFLLPLSIKLNSKCCEIVFCHSKVEWT